MTEKEWNKIKELFEVIQSGKAKTIASKHVTCYRTNSTINIVIEEEQFEETK